jgi:hypothetical protein
MLRECSVSKMQYPKDTVSKGYIIQRVQYPKGAVHLEIESLVPMESAVNGRLLNFCS